MLTTLFLFLSCAHPQISAPGVVSALADANNAAQGIVDKIPFSSFPEFAQVYFRKISALQNWLMSLNFHTLCG